MANLFWLNVTEAAGLAADGNEKMINAKDQVGMLASIRNATEKEISSSTTPRSIPDPWARAYLFSRYVLREGTEENLSEVQKKQQERIIGAWRGYLVMLALQQVYDISIQVKKVSGCTGIGESLWRNLPETDNKDKIYAGLNDSEAVYLFYANGQVVGMTHAAIGVVPGFCQNRFEDSYPWSDGMEFVDPVERLTRGERMIVYAWLTHLVDFYTENKEQPKVLNIVKVLISDMQLTKTDAELAVKASRHMLQAYTLKETKLQPFEERLKLNALDYSETRIDGSDFCLIDSVDQIESGKEKLVIGLLDELMYSRANNLFDKFLPESEKWIPISAHDMFLDRCWYFKTLSIENPDLDIESNAGNFDGDNRSARQGYVHLFPMKCEYVKMLEDVMTNGFNMSIAAGYLSAGVRFTVNGKTRSVVCNFPPETQVELISENMATTLVWPNVSGCREYHIAAQWNRFSGTSKSFIFLPVEAEIALQKVALKMRYITQKFPRFLKALWVDEKSALVLDCGVAMLKQPATAATQKITANYALDFGTSASIAAYNTGNPNDSKKVDFDNQIILLTPDERETDLANKLLFGAHGVVAPFPTIYYKDPFPTAVLFQGGHPYFEQPNKLIDPKEKEEFMESNIKFDFGKGGDMTFIQRDYIKGVIHMLLVHARKIGAERMKLKVSYPISIKETTEFQKKILEIVEDYENGKSGDGSDAHPFGVELSIKNVEFVTESEAATRYFYSGYTPKECITLDIGGGSADFFTYSNENNGKAMIASMVAGSRIFLLSLLRKRPSLFLAAMNTIRKKYPENKLEETWFNRKTYNDTDEFAFYSDIECLLQYNIITMDGAVHNVGTDIEDIFLNKMGELGTEENAHVLKQMKTIWLFQLAAFFYYGGMMYRYGKGNETPIDDTTIQFFLSGRGSQIINWLPPDGTEKVLIEMARLGMGANENVVITLNHEKHSKKTESAIGMLKEAIKSKTTAIKKEDFTFDYVAGEAYIDTREERKDGMNLLRHKCSSGMVEKKVQSMNSDFAHINPTLPVLTSFISTLNDHVINSELNDAVYRIELCETPSQMSKNKKSNSGVFLVDKKTLADLMRGWKKSIDSGEETVDVPLFFWLTNTIRDKAIEEWIGAEKY